MFYKPEIREKMHNRRKRLDAVTIAQCSQSVTAQVVYLKEFLNARSIAGYLAIDGELDGLPILHCAQTLDKKIYIPMLSGLQQNTLDFFSYQIGDDLVKNKYGIGEPNPHAAQLISPENLNVIFLPLMAFDDRCQRVGRGAGFYDRALAFVKENRYSRRPCLIGLAYEFQKIEQITSDSWDVPLDIVVTEKRVYVNR